MGEQRKTASLESTAEDYRRRLARRDQNAHAAVELQEALTKQVQMHDRIKALTEKISVLEEDRVGLRDLAVKHDQTALAFEKDGKNLREQMIQQKEEWSELDVLYQEQVAGL